MATHAADAAVVATVAVVAADSVNGGVLGVEVGV